MSCFLCNFFFAFWLLNGLAFWWEKLFFWFYLPNGQKIQNTNDVQNYPHLWCIIKNNKFYYIQVKDNLNIIFGLKQIKIITICKILTPLVSKRNYLKGWNVPILKNNEKIILEVIHGCSTNYSNLTV